MLKRKIIIGTRGSLLAVTQANQVKDDLERLTDCTFEFKFIKTQGDENTSKPLWQLDGKDFFTKELDSALLLNEVDMVIHSYKDLGSERPEGIELAAITKRNHSNDILLIRKEIKDKLNELDELVIGTSSPRRIFALEDKLAEFLPGKKGLKVKTKMLRGNVNTRIEKLKNGEYDGICLAFAGLNRLAKTKESRDQLEPLLDGLDFSVLPNSIFPSAASQGALALEIASNSPDYLELKKVVSSVHDTLTQKLVSIERKTFNSFGGGCHLAVGINVTKAINGMILERTFGEKDNKKYDTFNFHQIDSKVLKNPRLSSDLIKFTPLKINNDINVFNSSFDVKYCNNWVHVCLDDISKEEVYRSPLLKMFISDQVIDVISGEYELITDDAISDEETVLINPLHKTILESKKIKFIEV